MKITIINAYTWFNKGDAGILIGTIQQINKILTEQKTENIEINILSFTPDIDEKHYSKIENVKGVYSNILNPYPFKKTKFGKMTAILKLALESTKQNFTFFVSKQKAIKSYRQLDLIQKSDKIIICGGGFLGGKKFNSLIHLHQINLASQLGKPIYLWGTSIEPPTNSILKKTTEKVISKISHVYSREDITTNYLKTFLLSSKFSFTPDLAFMVPTEINKSVTDIYNTLPQNKNLIGLTVREWHFPNSSNPSLDFKKYKSSIAHMIEKLSGELDSVFVFIPQVIFKGDDDRAIAFEIKGMLSEEASKNFVILEDDLSPQEIKGLISKFEMFVGTRMHSNIFATGAFVPTVAIAYEKKTNGIMKMLDLEKHLVNIEDINHENIIALVKRCFKNRTQISNHLSNRIPEVQKEIDTQSGFLKEANNEYYYNILERTN